jgi:hypothetical protein
VITRETVEGIPVVARAVQAGAAGVRAGWGLLVHRVFISLPIRCSASALACT